MEEIRTLKYNGQYWLNWRQIRAILYSSMGNNQQYKNLKSFEALAELHGYKPDLDYVIVKPNMTCSGFAAGDIIIRMDVAETFCAYRHGERAMKLLADIANQRHILEQRRRNDSAAAYSKLQQQLRDASINAQNQISDAQRETRRYADAMAEVKRVANQFSVVKPRTYTGVVVSDTPTEQLSPTAAMAFRTDADEVATPSTPVEVTFTAAVG